MSSRVALVMVLALVLAGCANQPLPGENPTPARSEPAAPPPGGTAGSSVAPTYGASPEPAAGGVTLQDEAGATQAPSNAQREKDAEDCYTYAQASVARDIQVQDDRSAIFDTSSNSRDVYAFTNRLDEYGNQQRLGSLYDSCMAAKGYATGN